MTHLISGFVMRFELPKELAGRYGAAAPLKQQFRFLPWDFRFDPDQPPDALPETISTIGQEFASSGPCGFVATEYFGGDGAQGAAAWDGDGPSLPWTVGAGPNGPISAVCRLLGANKGAEDIDEFASVGFGAYRFNDEVRAVLGEVVRVH